MTHPVDIPHRRYNPLLGEWVQVSPHRAMRPWQGQTEAVATEVLPVRDPSCYLCPGNRRAGGLDNPAYQDTFVFTNDFAALLPEVAAGQVSDHPLLRAEVVPGTCRVICFSPRHDLTVAEMGLAEIRSVVDTWAVEVAELCQRYRWVQVFENKGAIMGCSNPHPHGQIWAMDGLPNQVAREDQRQRQYFEDHGRPLLVDYAQLESERGERVVAHNADWLAVVPYWAIWPFEIMLLPRRHVPSLADLDHGERHTLADALKRVLVKYDNLFQTSFPYSMGWHGAPGSAPAAERGYWQLHAHFYPPLLRSATVKKFMVGYELLGEVQRDVTAERAAERLRALSDIHYKQAG